MQTPIPPSVETLPSSLQRLIERLETEQPQHPGEMRKLMQEAEVPLADLLPWADYDHPAADSYGRRPVYQSDCFEVMVMSWLPGDMSTIHDHGHTQWGAVKVYGPAEHATFRIEEDVLSTTSRKRFAPGDVVGVSHSFIHQMGNPTEEPFLSLHIYGTLEAIDNVTGDARLFDLRRSEIQRIDGGVFFDLPEAQVKRREPGPRGDFPTRLRHMVELIRRMRRAAATPERVEAALSEAFGPEQQTHLLDFLADLLDGHQHQTNSLQWQLLNQEMQAAAHLQAELQAENPSGDAFRHYAELYDAVVCQPCLDHFMAPYLHFLVEALGLDFPQHQMLSVGCGTGLVEQYIQDTFGMPRGQMYGIDLSAAMIEVAQQRLSAEVGNVLDLDPALGQYSLVFSGLNVYQYLPPQDLAEAIRRTAAVVQPGGYFIADFITPDHIRWYPNVLTGADQRVVSLRTPRLVEEEGRMFQESEITNVNFLHGHMHVTYAGKHRRFLPPLHRVRAQFEQSFSGAVKLYDAISREEIPEWADSCSSTRYLVVAQQR